MCGRFAFFSPREAVQEMFGVECKVELQPRYNIAPTQPVLGLRLADGDRVEFASFRWGLVPSWARDPGIGNRMINARLETATEKPAFRAAFRRRRCAIAADGFYEWQAVADGPKQPWFITPAAGGPFLMAGLWEHWDKGEGTLETCTLLTTEASGTMRDIHHRMPVILPAESLHAWLQAPDAQAGLEVLAGVAATELRMQPVSRAVNRPANDAAELIQPIAI